MFVQILCTTCIALQWAGCKKPHKVYSILYGSFPIFVSDCSLLMVPKELLLVFGRFHKCLSAVSWGLRCCQQNKVLVPSQYVQKHFALSITLQFWPKKRKQCISFLVSPQLISLVPTGVVLGSSPTVLSITKALSEEQHDNCPVNYGKIKTYLLREDFYSGES